MITTALKALCEHIRWDSTDLYTVILITTSAPLCWAIIAKKEYHNQTFSKLFFNNRKFANYVLAAAIFISNLVRCQYIYKISEEDPKAPFLDTKLISSIGFIIFVISQAMVYATAYKLGIRGTYLGDHFGYVPKQKVTGLPFSICSHPMYVAAVTSIIGTGLYSASVTTLFISLVQALSYWAVVRYHESPYLEIIYSNADSKRKS